MDVIEHFFVVSSFLSKTGLKHIWGSNTFATDSTHEWISVIFNHHHGPNPQLFYFPDRESIVTEQKNRFRDFDGSLRF